MSPGVFFNRREAVFILSWPHHPATYILLHTHRFGSICSLSEKKKKILYLWVSLTSFETVFTHSEESRGVLILAVFQSGVILHFLHVVHCCIRYFPYMQKICCHCGNEHRHHCLVWPCFLSLGFTETCACACVCLQQIAASTYHTEICSLHWQNWPIIHPSVHPTIHPFIHPTIHAIRPLSRLQVQNSRQRCPHLLLPSHLLQHFWGDTNVLSKPRNLISAACAGSALRTFSWWDVWKRRASFQNCLWIS